MTNWSVSTFKAWCNEKQIQTSMENMTVGQLDTNLRRFYAEERNKSGESHSKTSHLGFMHSFERYLNAPTLSRGLKLSSDPRFKRSNEMLNAQIVRLKLQGKENVTHKPAIESEDLIKLKASPAIALNNPLALLRNVWFHVILFFCRRGREGQRQLKKTSFKFEVDALGRRFVTMAHDEATKNHPGRVTDVSSNEKLARMYETPEENDGYKALKFYMAKLNPRCDAFFQYPKKNSKEKYDDKVWFDARPIGGNKLDGMMKSISEEAKLSKMYTNHSLRATEITLWSNAGVENHHIMAISGHRGEQSLLHYNTQPSRSQPRTCSEVLSKSLTSDRSESLATVTAINIKKEVWENGLVVSTASDKTTSGFGSFFNNKMSTSLFITLGSNFSHTCGHLLLYCSQRLLRPFCNGLFSAIDILLEAF
ncbi:hypothetical protein AWC38_SpisGene18454 [Stylophora pistillata]|uniref:Uncharacterized protein n=2 Tax=Stylophora pistillata TaxID=50429 RepID=A0A2B4RJ76_STYPI|nr:hypothetical protein AWC38_SpisGene18454 [Stylophora pistillata]